VCERESGVVLDPRRPIGRYITSCLFVYFLRWFTRLQTVARAHIHSRKLSVLSQCSVAAEMLRRKLSFHVITLDHLGKTEIVL